MITVNYQKRKNSTLFSKFQSNQNTLLENVQNYIPIYERFFSLNSTNYNSINLNHLWALSDIKDGKSKDSDNDHVFNCKLKNIHDDEQVISKKIFIKMAPLLDPFKYMVGKYNHTDANLFNLPTIDKTVSVHPKISDPNNAAFIDGFFSYLTCQLMNTHQFIHGLDYYGSFLALKNNYKINIIDDIDYLIQSEYFNRHKNVLFQVEDYTHLITEFQDPNSGPLKALKISQSLKSNASILSAKSLNDSMFENIFDNQQVVSLADIGSTSLEDITNSAAFLLNTTSSETLKSGSTCSSRTSHTNEEAASDISSEADELDEPLQNDSIGSHYSSSDDGDSVEEETLMLTFPKFPIQVICMEKCEDTFDSLIMDNALSDDEWMSALMQIIMTLITYQKVFAFTHNDLHTNNIMYVPTNIKYIYYTYKKKTYKVPTFGKLYKIIDFGRAIYKFNGKLFCSDSFQPGGDAATQYNTEPYFNDKKPRLEPNYSFDLCRLACSIFDYVVDDFDTIKNLNNCSPLTRIIVEWCIDDNGINVLYKNNGQERYPDFKLYKMIARHVHKHTPVNQLERPEFSKFVISNKNIPKNEFIINIDEYPCYC